MKQVVRKGLREIIVDDVPDPLVTPHHVLIRPFCSLISSGTETASIHPEGLLRAVADDPSQLRKIWDALKVQPPLRTLAEVRAKLSEYAVPGYSGAGIVVDKHHTVEGLEIGDRVAYGGEGTGHAETILAAKNLVVRVPDPVDFETASFATLGSIALNAVRIANIGLGERVVVIGLGLVGQLVAQLVRLQGGVVMAHDLKRERVELAARLGADHVLLDPGSPREAVNFLTDGRGADCVIIAAAAKSAAPCQLAVELCRDRGRIVDVGAVDLSFPWYQMFLKEIQLFMARNYGPGTYDPVYEKLGQDYPFPYVRWTEKRNMEEFLRWVSLQRIHLEPLISHRFPLDEATKAYQTILDPSSGSMAVILTYPAASGPDPVTTFAPKRSVPVVRAGNIGDKLGVALVGAGNIARWVHLPNLKKIAGASLRAIHSMNAARSKSYALRFGAAYCCTDYEIILKDPDIHVVVIASRNQHHAGQAGDALRAGKHVFLEKPMALTEEECRAVCKAVEETGRQLTVGFNRRFASFYGELKRELIKRTGPAVLNCRVNSPGISGSYWMADPSSGGAILGEACHFVDLMYWLLEAEPVSVSAFSLPTGRREPIGENNLAASFRFADGSIGNLTYCTVGSKTSAGERVEAFAEGFGAFSEDFKRLAIRRTLTSRRSRLYADKGYEVQLRSFFEGIRQDRSPEVTARDGARATLGCLRMLESARTSSPCEIDLDAALS